MSAMPNDEEDARILQNCSPEGSSIGALRAAVVTEAKTWIGTPFHHAARVRSAGVDCLMLLAEVYERAGVVAGRINPPFYVPDWHLHRDAERYMEGLLRYARPVDAPEPTCLTERVRPALEARDHGSSRIARRSCRRKRGPRHGPRASMTGRWPRQSSIPERAPPGRNREGDVPPIAIASRTASPAARIRQVRIGQPSSGTRCADSASPPLPFPARDRRMPW